MSMKVVFPKQLFDIDGFERAVDDALDETALDVQAEFGKTTATWENKPTFRRTKPRPSMRVISTDSAIYGYVNDGTKPHVIKAKTSRGLVFKPGGSPKTQRGIIGSGPGKRGANWVVKDEVQHPGTEARDFAAQIGDEAQDDLTRRVEQAIKKHL